MRPLPAALCDGGVRKILASVVWALSCAPVWEAPQPGSDLSPLEGEGKTMIFPRGGCHV